MILLLMFWKMLAVWVKKSLKETVNLDFSWKSWKQRLSNLLKNLQPRENIMALFLLRR